MADISMTPMQAPKIDADPSGDLILVVGPRDDQKSIRASSKVLSLASPVFAAMFSPSRFSEGTALSSSNPPEVHLPDDDSEVVTTFCHLVHFREYHRKEDHPSLDHLISIAIFCNKYDAGPALYPWSELWLNLQSGWWGSEICADYPNLLALAYTFNNQESFWMSSRSMMLYETAEFANGARSELQPLLPQDLYASIDQDRKSALLDLSSTIDRLVVSFFQDETGCPTPDLVLLKAGYFFRELHRLNIWPISTRCNAINLGCIQRKLVFFEKQDNRIYQKGLQKVVARAIDAQRGLCLACLRKGKVSSLQGNCHARFRYSCTG